ncbi:inositol monophosphatase [Chromatiales bacterium (ex Bugula neritina AB1)]|nr:inositol monophosphatase [Chromatiales bacterium (ex Bugula neritina AB1)]
MHPMMNIAIRAARAGGRVLTQHMDRVESIKVDSKGLNDFVTEVDFLTEREIVSTLSRSYPEHGFIAEESGETGNPDAEFKWYIDPLDGTKNFIHGYPSFCVSIAAAQHGKVEQAVIYNPVSQELFTATRGGGATLDGKRLRVGKRNGLEEALLGTGYDFNGKTDYPAYLKTQRRFTALSSGIRSQGSAALDLAYVAAGRLDGFWEYDLKPWDIAAGALLVREAGGLVGDMSGEEGWFESGNLVAASPRVFGAMIHTIKSSKVFDINLN